MTDRPNILLILTDQQRGDCLGIEGHPVLSTPPGPDTPVDPTITALVKAYLAKPYRMVIRGTPEEGYFAEVPELPNCMSSGSTPEEATAMLRDAMEGWLLVSLEQGDTIPEPSPEPASAYSGRFLLRVPRSLHRALAERAEREGVSLNQLVLTYVSRGLGSPA